MGIGTNLLDEFYNQNLVTGSYAVQESGGSVTEIGLVSYVGRANLQLQIQVFPSSFVEKRWNF
jgi:hypothetical protein